MKLYQKASIISGLLFIVLYIGFRITYSWITGPSICAKCHESEPYLTSWEKSVHQNIDCRDCHQSRGPFGRLDIAFRGFRDIGIHIKGDYSFLMKSVYYDSNCINCHLGDFKSDTKAPMLPENHAKLIKSGQGCNNCHRDTGHKNGLGVDAKFETLES